MNRKKLIACFILMGLLLSSCSENGRFQMTFITEGEHLLSERNKGDLIILGGAAILEQDAAIEGNAHVISGKLQLDGIIDGDLTFLGGEVILGPQGKIHGDLNYGGGDLSHLDQVAVSGMINAGAGIEIPSVDIQNSQRPDEIIIRGVVNAAVLALLAVILSRWLQGPCRRINESALRHTLVSLAMGILVGIVGITLVVVLAYTILLIPVALLGLVLLGTSIILGWVACGIALGQFAKKHLKLEISTNRAVFGGTFAAMLIFHLVTVIPFAGGIIGILVASTSLGAVFLTRFGTRRFIPESVSST